MAKSINKKSTEKRTYKHSDAWLKAHKEKLAKKQLAQKPAKRGHPKKTIAKNADIRKVAIKQKLAKKTDVKKINSLFEDAKKKNAAIKNTMKQMSEVVSGILSNGDQKTYDKLMKKLAFYGFTIVDGTLANTITTVKIKLPKTKALHQKPSVDSEKPTDEVSVPGEQSDDNESNEAVDAEDDTAATIPDVEAIDEDQEEHEDDIEDEDDDADADDLEMEGLDDDEKAQLREDRRMAKEYERGQRADSDDMISDAMRENGDWD